MKKSILVLFILVCNLSFGQTRDLQQSIDSFRTALSQQNIQIKNLQAQVYNLNKILNAVKNDLSDVSNYSLTDTTGGKWMKSKTVVKSTVNKSNRVSTVNVFTEEPKDARYYRTIHGKKIYIARNGRKFYIAPNGRRIYVKQI